jgi:hypothetical protein
VNQLSTEDHARLNIMLGAATLPKYMRRGQRVARRQHRLGYARLERSKAA